MSCSQHGLLEIESHNIIHCSSVSVWGTASPSLCHQTCNGSKRWIFFHKVISFSNSQNVFWRKEQNRSDFFNIWKIKCLSSFFSFVLGVKMCHSQNWVFAEKCWLLAVRWREMSVTDLSPLARLGHREINVLGPSAVELLLECPDVLWSEMEMDKLLVCSRGDGLEWDAGDNGKC